MDPNVIKQLAGMAINALDEIHIRGEDDTKRAKAKGCLVAIMQQIDEANLPNLEDLIPGQKEKRPKRQKKA